MFGGARATLRGGAMLTSPLYISQVKKVRADGRPFFTHADRPGFGAAAMGGVWCRQGDWIIIAASVAETASLDLPSTTNYAGSLARPKSCRIALKPLSEPVRSTRAGRYFCNSVLIPAGRFRT